MKLFAKFDVVVPLLLSFQALAGNEERQGRRVVSRALRLSEGVAGRVSVCGLWNDYPKLNAEWPSG